VSLVPEHPPGLAARPRPAARCGLPLTGLARWSSWTRPGRCAPR